MSATLIWNDAPLRAKTKAGFRGAVEATKRLAQARCASKRVAASITSAVYGDTAYIRARHKLASLIESGTKPHEIAPRKKEALKFGGEFAESVSHPGTQARPFLGPAAAVFPETLKRFLRAQMF